MAFPRSGPGFSDRQLHRYLKKLIGHEQFKEEQEERIAGLVQRSRRPSKHVIHTWWGKLAVPSRHLRLAKGSSRNVWFQLSGGEGKLLEPTHQ